MQVTGVIAIENIYGDTVVKMDRDGNELINLPKCGFIRTTKSRICLFSNSTSKVRSDRNIKEKLYWLKHISY